jgi:hypothetical protein
MSCDVPRLAWRGDPRFETRFPPGCTCRVSSGPVNASLPDDTVTCLLCRRVPLFASHRIALERAGNENYASTFTAQRQEQSTSEHTL